MASTLGCCGTSGGATGAATGVGCAFTATRLGAGAGGGRLHWLLVAEERTCLHASRHRRVSVEWIAKHQHDLAFRLRQRDALGILRRHHQRDHSGRVGGWFLVLFLFRFGSRLILARSGGQHLHVAGSSPSHRVIRPADGDNDVDLTAGHDESCDADDIVDLDGHGAHPAWNRRRESRIAVGGGDLVGGDRLVLEHGREEATIRDALQIGKGSGYRAGCGPGDELDVVLGEWRADGHRSSGNNHVALRSGRARRHLPDRTIDQEAGDGCGHNRDGKHHEVAGTAVHLISFTVTSSGRVRPDTTGRPLRPVHRASPTWR